MTVKLHAQTTTDTPTRSRDAARSKQALLVAAQELFSQKGFEQTTIREIGERAQSDPALIARYYGSKADLYIATVLSENAGDPDRPDVVSEETYDDVGEIIDVILTRSDTSGPGPILQALIRGDTNDEIREAARTRLMRRLTDPLAARLEADGADRPSLRAETVVAAVLGISHARSLGWFDGLSTVPRQELAALIADALIQLSNPTAAS